MDAPTRGELSRRVQTALTVFGALLMLAGTAGLLFLLSGFAQSYQEAVRDFGVAAAWPLGIPQRAAFGAVAVLVVLQAALLALMWRRRNGWQWILLGGAVSFLLLCLVGGIAAWQGIRQIFSLQY